MTNYYNDPVYQSVAKLLEEIRETVNVKDLKITIVLRADSFEQDIVMTDDDLNEVVATLMRDDNSKMQ